MNEIPMTQEQKDRVRAFLVQRGTPVERTSDVEGVSRYGWQDHRAYEHVHSFPKAPAECQIVIPPHVVVREVRYQQFTGTFADDIYEVGVECPAACACGRYPEFTVRWVGSIGDLLFAAFSSASRPSSTLEL